MQYYKVLDFDGSCYYGGTGKWLENVSMPALDPTRLKACEYGYHILEPQDLVYWLGPAIAPVLLPSNTTIIRSENKTIVDQAMRGPFLTSWHSRTQRAFAADCAEHVLHIYERKYPNDDRPAKAIQAARALANGLISDAAYADAAYAAYADAAYAAGAAAAYADAAYAAADAAYAAAYAAAHAAATRGAAAYAAYATRAADAAERAWQTQKLFEYLGVPVNA